MYGGCSLVQSQICEGCSSSKFFSGFFSPFLLLFLLPFFFLHVALDGWFLERIISDHYSRSRGERGGKCLQGKRGNRGHPNNQGKKIVKLKLRRERARTLDKLALPLDLFSLLSSRIMNRIPSIEHVLPIIPTI